MYTKVPDESISVLITDGESNYALYVLQCLSRIKNLKVYILSNDPWARIRFSRDATQFISYINKNGDEGILTAIFDAVKKTKVDVVLPVDSYTIRLLSSRGGAIAQLTSIVPLPNTESLDIAEDKWLLAGWLQENKIPCPPTILYQTNTGFDEVLTSFPFPVLIKPKKGSGGVGIEFFDTQSALNRFCNEHATSGEYIIQSYINGYDIDCSVLCVGGEILAYTIQKGIMYSTKRVSWPSGIDFLYDEATFNIVKELAEKFKWSGIVHIDLRYDEKDKQVKIIEMNPRFWASVSASTFAGVNFPYIACLAALNRELPKVEFQPKRVVRSGAAIRILAQGIVHRKQKDLYFDNSFIEFSLRDPLPNVVSKFSKIYNKVFSKK
jgi:predicted ATP-grasp superfamily ATP-dependent carboligase